MTVDEMISKLSQMLIEKRFNHSVGVMNCAVEMAELYGADVEKHV